MARTFDSQTISIWLFLAKISGLLGSVLISWNFILATRNFLIEKLFGGLDKVYKIHNIIGNIAFILVIYHPIFLIINSLPFNLTKTYLIPNITNIAYTSGMLALYSLIILVILTIFAKLSYKLWKKTHELMGLVIIFASIHSLLITSDVSIFLPLKIWIIAINIIAILAYAYKRFFYYIYKPKNNYQITSITQDKNYLLISLAATDKDKFIKFRPGQFAFFSVNFDRRDEHPFSILEQNGQHIKIGAKIIGKFTLNLSKLKVDTRVNVFGPFGTFADNLFLHKKMIWISGGIGITPFLSMAKNLSFDQQVTMIHTARSDESKLFTDLFNNYSSSHPNFKFIIHYSNKFNHLTKQNISEISELDSNINVYLCGPKKMMEDLKQERTIYEDFNLK